MSTANIIIQGISDNTLTLSINGEVREIQNQLAELKALLLEQKTPNVQYAEKIYNIEHIDEANFGFITGKKTFNEVLTKQLIEAIRPFSIPADRFLERVADIPGWETQLRISDKAKEIIAYSFVGMIGIQLSKLMAIGKEDFSEAKQRKYIEKCLQIAKRTLDLICFALISRLWDALKHNSFVLNDQQKQVLKNRFDNAFEPSVAEQFALLKALHEVFSRPGNMLTLPIPEMADFSGYFQENSPFHQTCQALQSLNESVDKSQYDLLACYEAEIQLANFFKVFHFLVNYHMASIKQIGYRQIRNADPFYLHRYAALGIDSKANIDAEKMNYTTRTVHTDAVLLYRGHNYEENTNLFPFVIDYNALTFEQGAKICFYHAQEITDGSLEYLFLEDNSMINVERKGILKADTDYNELMMNNDNRKILNLDSVVEQFREARNCLLDEMINPDDLLN